MGANTNSNGTPWRVHVFGVYSIPKMPKDTIALADLILTIGGVEMRVRGWRVVQCADGRVEACAPRVWAPGRMKWRPLFTPPRDILDGINSAVMHQAALSELVPAEPARLAA